MFSSDPLKPLSQTVNVEFTEERDTSIPIEETYEVQKCVDWIKRNNYSKVCLQFPDSLLSDSVEVALLFEEKLENKTYILGDTSYGSCCVDEIAAQHIKADALIHFGHACLSRTARLPVLYVFPRRSLDISQLKGSLRTALNGTTLFIYDIGYHHLVDNIRSALSELDLILSVLLLEGSEPVECCRQCSRLTQTNRGEHTQVNFCRGFCLPPSKQPDTILYLGNRSDLLLTNFMLFFKGSDALVYDEVNEGGKLERVKSLPLLKQTSFLVEEVKSAGTVGIVVATLSVEGYLEAVAQAKALLVRAHKKVYLLSVGKPTVPKLSNFPQIEVYVAISCPEATFPHKKEVIQPIATLLEVELALNENRNWDNTFSRDFRDLIPGGSNYVALPEGCPESTPEVSLTTGRLTGSHNITSTDLAVNEEKSLITCSSKIGGTSERTWNGLRQDLGKTEVCKATPGRSGTSMEYSSEPPK